MAKVVVPFAKEKNNIIVFLDNFGACCGLVRKVILRFKKVLRIGRYVSAFRNIANRMHERKGCPFTRFMKNLADLALSLYFLFDHILLVNKINAYKFSDSTVKLADFLSNFAWLIETLASLTYQSLEIYGLSEEILRSKIDIKKIDSSVEGILIMT